MITKQIENLIQLQTNLQSTSLLFRSSYLAVASVPITDESLVKSRNIGF